MQLSFPLVIAFSFFRHGDKFPPMSSCAGLGGIICDWHFILGRAGLLNRDQGIGNVVWCAGFAVIAYSVFRGISSAGEEKTESEIPS